MKPVSLFLLIPRKYPSILLLGRRWSHNFVTVFPFSPRSCSSHVFFLLESPVTSLSQSSIVNRGKEVCEYPLLCHFSYHCGRLQTWIILDLVFFFSNFQFCCTTLNCLIYPTSNSKTSFRSSSNIPELLPCCNYIISYRPVSLKCSHKEMGCMAQI